MSFAAVDANMFIRLVGLGEGRVGRWGFGEEEEEEAGGDSSSDLAESLCQDFALPRRSPSLSLALPLTLSPLTHTLAEVPERNRELTGEFLGIVGGISPP